jgi:toxin ParE1/3/4
MRVLYSARARGDLADIRAWTAERFGQAQADEYLRDLLRTLQFLAKNPGLARVADDIRPGLAKYVIASHVAFLRISGDELRVVRILHGRMDWPRRV